MKTNTIVVLIAMLLASALSSTSKIDQFTAGEIDGGIVLHITNAFLKTVKNQVIDSLIQAFKPDHAKVNDTINLSLFNLTYNVFDITMYQFQMNYEASKIAFQATKPNLVVEFIDFMIDLEFNYSIIASPKFYVDEGPGKVKFAFRNISIGLDMYQDAGVFQFKTSNIFADFTDGNTTFEGQGDLSFILNSASSLIRNQMLTNPSGTVSQIINSALPLINGQLKAAGCTANMTGLLFNWCAMADPTFDSNSVSLVFKGEVTSKVDEIIPFEDKRKVPYVIDPTGRDIQISVSDYFLNSTLYSAFNLGMLQFEVSELGEGQPLTADTFKILWPDITKYMNPQQRISIKGVANSTMIPYLEIVDGLTSVKGLVDLSFAEIDSNGNTRNIFLQMTSNFNVAVDLEIQTPFKLLTDIKQLKIKASELYLDKYSLTNIEDLNSVIGTISGFIRNYLNRILTGYRYQEFDLGFLKIDVNQTSLFERERYIYLDSQPKFHHNDRDVEILRAPLQHYVKRPVSYKDKVDALANILKLTPIYQGIKEMKKHEALYRNVAFAVPGALPNTYDDLDEYNNMPKESPDAKIEMM